MDADAVDGRNSLSRWRGRAIAWKPRTFGDRLYAYGPTPKRVVLLQCPISPVRSCGSSWQRGVEGCVLTLWHPNRVSTRGGRPAFGTPVGVRNQSAKGTQWDKQSPQDLHRFMSSRLATMYARGHFLLSGAPERRRYRSLMSLRRKDALDGAEWAFSRQPWRCNGPRSMEGYQRHDRPLGL